MTDEKADKPTTTPAAAATIDLDIFIVSSLTHLSCDGAHSCDYGFAFLILLEVAGLIPVGYLGYDLFYWVNRSSKGMVPTAIVIGVRSPPAMKQL
jgi:hypothetical protein